MTSESDNPPVHRLYSDISETGEKRVIAEELWGQIPSDMEHAYRLLNVVKEKYGPAPDALEELKKAMKRQLRKLGILTSLVTENIDRLDQGVVEAGQQPMCLGGPSLILNKVAYAKSLSDIGESDFVPLFYVADYDGIQPELLNIRVPSPSPRGLLITYPTRPELEEAPIYNLQNPPEAWLKQTVEKIQGNYKGLLKDIEHNLRDRLLQNLDHALTVMRSSYYSTENVSDWSTKTLGSLINVEANLGVPIYSFSMPGTRHLFQSGYEFLLSEPSRSKFIEASNRAVNLIEGAHYRPQIGRRADDYIPFFFECETPQCHRSRIELKYRHQTGSSSAYATGKCPRCGEAYDISFNIKTPDLSDVIDWITPRVDSRQVIVDSVIPVLAHVGGPGETSYYAEVIPAVRGLGIPFPLFLRYTRAFYNTPWNELYSNKLKEKGLPTLISDELFSALHSWVEARNARDSAKLRKAHIDIRGNVEGTYEEFLGKLKALKSDVDSIKKRLSNPQDRSTLLREMREKQSLANEIETYLSSAFGRFSPERFGQEVSWCWLDLAVVSGVKDLLGVFLRQYGENTPISSMFFVNL